MIARPSFALALAALVLPAAARAQQVLQLPPTPPAVVTNGRGEATVAPDRAVVMLSVETRAATATQAAADNARVQQKVLTALRGLGLPNERLGTAGYSVSPEMAYAEGQSPRVTGYVARNTVRADLRDVTTVGRVIDVSLAAGANNVAGVEFSASKLDDARRAATTDAVRAACRDADAVARAANGVLGRPIELSTSYEQPGPRPMMAAMARVSAEQTPINAGDLTVVVTVNARWSLLPADAGSSAMVMHCP